MYSFSTIKKIVTRTRFSVTLYVQYLACLVNWRCAKNLCTSLMFWTSLWQSSLCCCFVQLGQKEGSMFSRPLDCIHFVFRRLGLMPFLVSVWCIQGLPVDCHFRVYKDIFELSLHVGGTWLNPNLWPRSFPPCGDFWVLCARDTKATKKKLLGWSWRRPWWI